MLQYFKDRPDSPTHIVIIAGLMVGRGLNIVSNDYRWHLTHQILKMPSNATCSDLAQRIRLLGIYRDTVPTTLFCVQKDAMSLKQAHQLQNRIYEGAELHEEVENMPTLCEQIKVYVGLVPKRKTTKKCDEPHWNLVAKEREQYGEVVEEKMDGMYYCVIVDKLAPREMEIYKYAVDYLQDKTGQWIERSKIVEHAVRGGEEEHSVRSFLKHICLTQSKNMRTESENIQGLLFKKSGNRWFIRLN
jgi:hypothetical protein